MEARWALAFVARREGRDAMEASRWRHVMSLELGWMPPGQAARYVEASVRAGLLRVDGDVLALTFEPGGETIPRGFRPDPEALPEAAVEEDGGFASWLARLAAARGDDVGATMEAVDAVQQDAPGLHAEAAVLLLAARAGMDVRHAARDALTRLRV